MQLSKIALLLNLLQLARRHISLQQLIDIRSGPHPSLDCKM